MPLLRIGLLPSLAWPLAPLVTALARERMRIPELVLRTSLANDHQDLLTNREVDLVVTSDALYDVDGLERHVLLREPFYLVLPKEVEAPNGLEALAARLPYIRFSTRSPLGRRIEQHLRRVRAELPRSLEVDRASAVMAMIAAGQGFSILPPSLILDGWAPAAPTRIEALPLTAFSRTITLVCRQGELGSTPAALAAEMRKALKQHLRRHLLRHLPKAGAEIHFED